MEAVYKITYVAEVTREDIPRLDHSWGKEIYNAIEKKLTTRPEVYGKPLRQSLRGYRVLRVGDYRVVFRIETPSVKVFAILHRAVVYVEMQKRI